MDLLDKRIVFAFKDFNFGTGWDYRYITEPPLFADIGRFDFNIKNVTFMTNFTTSFKNGILKTNISELELDIKEWDF